MNKKEKIIGYYVLEDCTLEGHIYEYGETILVAEHGEDNDWPGTDFFEKHSSIFTPVYIRIGEDE